MGRTPSLAAIGRGLRADPRRLLLAAAALWLLGGALRMPPRSYGDGGEYHLTTESFARHLTPDARPGDVSALAERDRRTQAGVNFAAVLAAYFEDRGGRWHAVHFWGYSLLTTPARVLLGVLHLDAMRHGQLTNAVLLLFALQQVLFRAAFAPRVALSLGLLVLLSPAVWFVRWTHPEAFCFSLVVLALAWTRSGRRRAAVLAAAAASMQNPVLALLAVPLWVRAWWRERSRFVSASAAALPAALPALFYLWRYGVPSLIAHKTAAASNLSLGRAAEVLFDMNLGLLPYAPVAVLLFVAALPLSLRDRRWAARVWGLAVLAGLLAWSCTTTGTWNHGTTGPSRYAVWIAALVLFTVAESQAWIEEHAPPAARRWTWTAVGLAVATQAAVVAGRGGLDQAEDFLEHSYAARLALRHAPALYNPTPEIFVSRTLRRPSGPEHPALYRDETGCRKAWVRPRELEWLRQECGDAPPGYQAFFSQRGRDRRQSWSYVSYP